MNPKISIAIDAKNRAVVTTTGMVTVGSKVDVEITGLPSQIPDWAGTDKWYGKSVRFRVVNDAGQDIVRFPLAEKSGASATDGDKWTVVAAAGTSPETYKTSDGTATSPYVEFDTDGLRRKMACVPFCECREFGVIIDSIVDAAEYAVGKIKVRQWAKASTEDPTVLPDWRDTLDALRTDLSAVDASKAAAAASASSAATAATTAGNSATLAGQYADAALVNKDLATSAKNAAEAAQAAAAASKTDAETAQDAAEDAQEAAEAAASKYPYIDANGHWKVWDNGAWVDKGSAKGDKGDTGETGAQGPQGQQGIRGIQGVAGAAATVTVGSTVTLPAGSSALVENVGSTSAAEFKFSIPQGAKGDKGDTGDVEQVLTGETMSANPTQRQIATAVKKIWTELGGTVAAVMLAFAAFGDVTRSTEWQDVPPNTTLGAVVDLGGGGGGVSTNAVSGIITNHVTSGYLCTVAAANDKLAEAKSYTQELTSQRAKFVDAGNYKKFAFLDSPILLDYGLLVLDSWLEVDNWKIREISSNKTLDEHIDDKIASATNATIAATKEIFILQGTNTQPRLEFTNSNTMSLQQTDPNGQFVKTLDWGGDGLGWQMTGLAVNINPAVYVMSVFDMGTNGFSFAQGIVRNQTERESRPASTLKPDGSPVLTRNAADARFAPTNVAVAVASKIDAAGALGVFNANADYALTNLADNATAATLASGTIANLETTGNALNVTLSLGANNRSADAMLRIVNTQDVSLGIGNQGVALDGAWPSTIKAGTNLVMFCKTAYKNNTAVITVTSKEIK